jgi:hypothetical protein
MVDPNPGAPDLRLEATGLSDAHQFSKRPSHVTKPGNSRQATIGHGRRHGDSETSWVKRPLVEGDQTAVESDQPAVEGDQPAQRTISRKRPMSPPDEVPTSESEGRFMNIAERR